MTLTNPWFLLAAIPVFGLCVLIHELGHFLTAKWAGIRVEEFGLGLPPRLVGFRKRDSGGWEVIWLGGPRTIEDAYRDENQSPFDDVADGVGTAAASLTQATPGIRSNGTPNAELDRPERHHTIYSLNFLPIGGFVRMPGENGDANDENGRYDAGSFAAKSAGKRIIVLVAGVTMNIILAMVLFMFAYGVGQPVAPAQIGQIEVGSPAQMAGLKPSDTILSINGQSVQTWDDVVNTTNTIVSQHPGAKDVPIVVIARHQGQQGTFTTNVDARVNPPPGKGKMGITVTNNIVLVKYPFWQAPVKGIQETYSVTSQFISTIGQMVAGQIKPQISGPVGIVKFTGEVAQTVPTEGLWPVLSLTAILSINLAIVNILPFPALDGGRIFLILIELLRGGKRLKPEVEGLINLAGMAILLTLMIVITFSDVLHWNG
ncbi:MAG TPA: M50 family metallopeptidase [Ktedonobacteraceae bacterium]|jgi:regulator of sigma E protease|nr:M50 family metallopeptidase [Ktedonobacteraceae bacterium]